MLYECYMDVIAMLYGCYMNVIWMLLRCYMDVIAMLYECYSDVIWVVMMKLMMMMMMMMMIYPEFHILSMATMASTQCFNVFRKTLNICARLSNNNEHKMWSFPFRERN